MIMSVFVGHIYRYHCLAIANQKSIRVKPNVVPKFDTPDLSHNKRGSVAGLGYGGDFFLASDSQSAPRVDMRLCRTYMYLARCRLQGLLGQNE